MKVVLAIIILYDIVLLVFSVEVELEIFLLLEMMILASSTDAVVAINVL